MRLIDADRLPHKDLSDGKRMCMVVFSSDIASAPTVDAVEVVRCRDCKHWVRDGNESFGYAMFCKANCSLGGQGIKKPDDFCSYGERKTE